MNPDEQMRQEFEAKFPEAAQCRSKTRSFAYIGEYGDLYEGFEAGYETAVHAMTVPEQSDAGYITEMADAYEAHMPMTDGAVKAHVVKMRKIAARLSEAPQRERPLDSGSAAESAGRL